MIYHTFSLISLPPFRYIKTELERHNKKKVQCETEIQQLQLQIQETDKHLTDRRKRLSQLDPEIQNLRMNISELENYEYPAEDETDHMVTQRSQNFIRKSNLMCFTISEKRN